MVISTQAKTKNLLSCQSKTGIIDLLSKLDEAINDMEQGRVQTIGKYGKRLMRFKGIR